MDGDIRSYAKLHATPYPRTRIRRRVAASEWRTAACDRCKRSRTTAARNL